MNQHAEKTKSVQRMSGPVLVFWLAFFAGVGYLFFKQLDYVGMGCTVAIAFTCFSGHRMGASGIVATLVGIAAAISSAPQLGISCEHRFAQWFGTTGLLNRFLSIGTIGLLILLTVTMITMMISNRIVKDRPRLAQINRWLGFFIGAAEGSVAVLLLLGGILIIEPIEERRAELLDVDAGGQTIVQTVLLVADATRESRLGPLIETYNPFTRIPRLNQIEKIQQTVQVIGDPNRINKLLHHPSIVKLQQRSDVKLAVEALMLDPDIQQFLQTGKVVDQSTALMLLKHPAVLDLLDQPGFLEQANEIIDEMDLLTHSSR